MEQEININASAASHLHRDQEDHEDLSSQRLSRKDSAQLSQRSQNSRPATPKVINSEIRMSSSRLHQESDDIVVQPPVASESHSVASKSPASSYRSRNHSEPASIQQQQVISPFFLNQSPNSLPKISALPNYITYYLRRKQKIQE